MFRAHGRWSLWGWAIAQNWGRQMETEDEKRIHVQALRKIVSLRKYRQKRCWIHRERVRKERPALDALSYFTMFALSILVRTFPSQYRVVSFTFGGPDQKRLVPRTRKILSHNTVAIKFLFSYFYFLLWVAVGCNLCMRHLRWRSGRPSAPALGG